MDRVGPWVWIDGLGYEMGTCSACKFFDPLLAPDVRNTHMGQCRLLSGPTPAVRAQARDGTPAAVFVAPTFGCLSFSPPAGDYNANRDCLDR